MKRTIQDVKDKDLGLEDNKLITVCLACRQFKNQSSVMVTANLLCRRGPMQQLCASCQYSDLKREYFNFHHAFREIIFVTTRYSIEGDIEGEHRGGQEAIW